MRARRLSLRRIWPRPTSHWPTFRNEEPSTSGRRARRTIAPSRSHRADLESARASCEATPDFWTSQHCLAVIYDKLGRHADAEAVLSKMKTEDGDTSAYQYATIYAQWGNTLKALEWLDTALRLRDPGLVQLKTDPLMEPLRKEPRFKAIERELKFPD